MAQEQAGVRRWLELIQAEYREMPDLSLNKTQMQRLRGFDAFICDALVDALVAARVLRRTAPTRAGLMEVLISSSSRVSLKLPHSILRSDIRRRSIPDT